MNTESGDIAYWAKRAGELELQRDELAKALTEVVAAAYPDDPGTSDLYDEQPVSITLGDVRRVWRVLAKVKQ